MKFIELNRTFKSPDKSENDYSYLLSPQRGAGDTTWEDLLREKRVVVLASAGSGKTEEFRQQAAKIQTAGGLGLFFAIEELADQSVSDCLNAADELALANWRANAQPGYFFLDSVDEAKLRDKHAFRRALRKLAKTLGDRLERAHIFVSSRPSDWDHETDRDHFVRTFAIPAPPQIVSEEDKRELSDDEREQLLFEPVLKVTAYNGTGDQVVKKTESDSPKPEATSVLVALNPLDVTQQRALIDSIVGNKSDELIRAIKLQGLEPFAKRPSDLLQLARYYQKRAGFGSLAEMTKSSIEELLDEPPGRPDGDILSGLEAYTGAKRLALSLVLGKKLTLRAPAEDQIDDDDTIDPFIVLHDWTPAKIEALLRRALFAPASFGRIRFQHRSMIEYLSAELLNELLSIERHASKVMDLLFPIEFEVQTIPPELRPVVAWMASSNKRIRETVISCEPMELVRHGDPKSLSIEVRKRLLKSLAAAHNAGDVSRTEIDDRAVWAFASDELAQTIRECWTLNEHWEFRLLLLEIIAQGGIEACADLAEAAIHDGSKGRALIYQGIEALLAINDGDRLSQIAGKIVDGSLALSPDGVANVCRQLYPSFLTTDELLRLIEEAPTPKEFSTEGFSWRVQGLLTQCPEEDIDKYLDGVSSLSLSKPHVADWKRVSARYGYLAKHSEEIAHIALDRLKQPGLSQGLIKLLVAGERSDERGSSREFAVPLVERIDKDKTLKEALVWADVQEVKTSESKRDLDKLPHLRISAGYRGRYWNLSIGDAPWLKRNALDASVDEYQSDTAYYLWVRLVLELADITEHEAELRSAATNSLRSTWLAKELASKGKPGWQKKQEARQAKQHRKQLRREGAAKASWKRFKDELEKKIPDPDYSDGISNECWNFIHNLSNWLAWKSNLRKVKAPRTWNDLEPAFGRDVADAYLEHFRQLWRNVPHKRTRWNGSSSTSYASSAYCFAGIGMEADSDPDWASKLSSAEALQAAKHLARMDEGAPDWSLDLVSAHPDVVLPELRNELKRQWITPNEYPSSWLRFFADGQDELSRELGDIAISVIINNEPGQADRWDKGLRILRRVSLSHKQWGRVQKKARTAAKRKKALPAEVARHLSILCFQDINSAIDDVVTVLTHAKQKDAEAIIGAMFDGQHGHSLAADTLASASAATLGKLIKIIYKRVKLKDDVRHEGAYTPNSRDYAESARATVFNALHDNKSQAAYEMMRSLAKDKGVASSEHWLKIVSKRMIENMVQVRPWTEAQVREFVLDARVPINSRENFFELIKAILGEISNEFSTSDATVQRLLKRAGNEDEVRDWLLGELSTRASGRFDAFREARVHAEKRPDIIASCNSLESQVALELKHSDKGWSVKDLRKALTNQLVGLYLKPENRRCGILIISRHEKNYWINPETKCRMSFSELIVHLHELAKDLQANHYPYVRVSVMGIDCQETSSR